ncbi:tetratricopeptide repeat protein [Yersinia sp. LJYL362]|uniref:tetratricopeptide repeat protein n=1 Tax=Yersinia sp. LJYL362 TaxID=3402108 RepID=UPI003AB58596
MYKNSRRILIIFIFTLLINACSWNRDMSRKEVSYRESILTKAKNYGGLITLYRNKLKIKEDDTFRLKLANAYYLAGDTESSLYFLEPIAHKKNESIYLLQAKNLINKNDDATASIVINKLITMSPKNAEAHNMKGIILASNGKINEAKKSINQSRNLFISDEIAMNNLAVVAMLDKRYTEAVRILLPDYLAGKRGSFMLHNLVFSLIKIDDDKYAKKIILAEKMAKDPDELILALSQINTLDKDNVISVSEK